MTLARFAFAIVAIFCLLSSPPAFAAAKAGSPDQFIASLGDNVIKVITDDTSSQSDKEQSFRRMFNESFDAEEVMKFILGRHWRSATEEQRREFRKAFEDLAVRTYATRFGQYSGEQFTVKDARPGATQDEYFVPSLIERPNGPPLRIDWKVRRNGEGWRIADIVADTAGRTLAVRGPAAAIRNADTFLRVFDNKQGGEQEIRVFRLEHISAREATALVRSQLQVRELVLSPERQRIAVRDTPERLDRVAALLASSDVSTK